MRMVLSFLSLPFYAFYLISQSCFIYNLVIFLCIFIQTLKIGSSGMPNEIIDGFWEHNFHSFIKKNSTNRVSNGMLNKGCCNELCC